MASWTALPAADRDCPCARLTCCRHVFLSPVSPALQPPWSWQIRVERSKVELILILVTTRRHDLLRRARAPQASDVLAVSRHSTAVTAPTPDAAAVPEINERQPAPSVARCLLGCLIISSITIMPYEIPTILYTPSGSVPNTLAHYGAVGSSRVPPPPRPLCPCAACRHRRHASVFCTSNSSPTCCCAPLRRSAPPTRGCPLPPCGHAYAYTLLRTTSHDPSLRSLALLTGGGCCCADGGGTLRSATGRPCPESPEANML